MFFCFKKKKKAGTLYISQAGSELPVSASQVQGSRQVSPEQLRCSVMAHNDPMPVSFPTTSQLHTLHILKYKKPSIHHISFDRGSSENKIPGADCSSEVGYRPSSCKARVQNPAPSIKATINKIAIDWHLPGNCYPTTTNKNAVPLSRQIRCGYSPASHPKSTEQEQCFKLLRAP